MKVVTTVWSDGAIIATDDLPLGYDPIYVSHDYIIINKGLTVSVADAYILTDAKSYNRTTKRCTVRHPHIIIIGNDVDSLESAIRGVPNNYEILIVTDSPDLTMEAMKHPLSTHVYQRQISKSMRHYTPSTNTINTCDYDYYQYNDDRHDDVIVYQRNRDESEYLKLIIFIINNNNLSINRTLTTTLSSFSETLKFDLRNHRMPILTTKRVPFKMVYEELLWFLKGSTTNDYLSERNIHIWDGNSSRQYLDSVKLSHYREGELGPIYGYQWRNFGKPYGSPSHGIYVDQIAKLVSDLKNNPYSRRHVLTAWNPNQIDEMALPPCHLMAIFKVDGRSLNCQLIMRSADMGLGVPFNIVSYSLLTHMLAKICNMTASCLAITMVDCHIYSSHVDALLKQVTRAPYGAPTIRFSDRINAMEAPSIDDFTSDDIAIDNYHCYPTIKMSMIV